uniref:C-type lectin domain-containing protein n=1 Tax=Oreochromis aureus TaxID=47969 RepID=A0A668U3F4_OREAU
SSVCLSALLLQQIRSSDHTKIRGIYDHELCASNIVCRWSSFNHSCYLLSESFGSWDAARKDCKDRGADLVVIDSAEEQTFLSTITTKDAWIGLNDKEQEGTWKWVDGTPLTLTYWASGQPDNGGEEDCAHVIWDKQKSWNDLSCSSSRQWICEKVSENN